ncbi:hypothetical protein ROHU_008594 [Labeo rohita]|uniref:Uncharacterized protein n=1 Tax=Labeo rohita TaxID=84645 RepID=A0A498M7Q6_LABRO|nr:hypothetical protein ROHU_008594 [Labeo rohita]
MKKAKISLEAVGVGPRRCRVCDKALEPSTYVMNGRAGGAALNTTGAFQSDKMEQNSSAPLQTLGRFERM